MPGIARPVLRYGQALLRERSEHVHSFDAALRWLIEDLFATMYASGGVGIAANQIGSSARVFVFDCPDASAGRLVGHVVNPEWVPAPTETVPVVHREGCLSLPNVLADITRPGNASVIGLDRIGAPVRIDGTGIGARCLQHEMEHLDGGMYIDHLCEADRNQLLETQAEFDSGTR